MTEEETKPATPLNCFLSYSDAAKQLDDPYCCFTEVTTTKNLALLPKFLSNVKSGVTEHLDRELNLYSEKLNGVLVAYKNIKLKKAYGTVISDDPLIYADIVADLIIFKPGPGKTLRGIVNKIGRDHVGCLVHGCFNASASKPAGLKTDLLNVGDEVLLNVDQILPVNGVLAITGSINQKSLDDLRLSKPPKKKGKDLLKVKLEFQQSSGNSDSSVASPTSGDRLSSKQVSLDMWMTPKKRKAADVSTEEERTSPITKKAKIESVDLDSEVEDTGICDAPSSDLSEGASSSEPFLTADEPDIEEKSGHGEKLKKNEAAKRQKKRGDENNIQKPGKQNEIKVDIEAEKKTQKKAEIKALKKMKKKEEKRARKQEEKKAKREAKEARRSARKMRKEAKALRKSQEISLGQGVMTLSGVDISSEDDVFVSVPKKTKRSVDNTSDLSEEKRLTNLSKVLSSPQVPSVESLERDKVAESTQKSKKKKCKKDKEKCVSVPGEVIDEKIFNQDESSKLLVGASNSYTQLKDTKESNKNIKIETVHVPASAETELTHSHKKSKKKQKQAALVAHQSAAVADVDLGTEQSHVSASDLCNLKKKHKKRKLESGVSASPLPSYLLDSTMIDPSKSHRKSDLFISPILCATTGIVQHEIQNKVIETSSPFPSKAKKPKNARPGDSLPSPRPEPTDLAVLSVEKKKRKKKKKSKERDSQLGDMDPVGVDHSQVQVDLKGSAWPSVVLGEPKSEKKKSSKKKKEQSCGLHVGASSSTPLPSNMEGAPLALSAQIITSNVLPLEKKKKKKLKEVVESSMGVPTLGTHKFISKKSSDLTPTQTKMAEASLLSTAKSEHKKRKKSKENDMVLENLANSGSGVLNSGSIVQASVQSDVSGRSLLSPVTKKRKKKSKDKERLTADSSITSLNSAAELSSTKKKHKKKKSKDQDKSEVESFVTGGNAEEVGASSTLATPCQDMSANFKHVNASTEKKKHKKKKKSQDIEKASVDVKGVQGSGSKTNTSMQKIDTSVLAASPTLGDQSHSDSKTGTIFDYFSPCSMGEKLPRSPCSENDSSTMHKGNERKGKSRDDDIKFKDDSYVLNPVSGKKRKRDGSPSGTDLKTPAKKLKKSAKKLSDGKVSPRRSLQDEFLKQPSKSSIKLKSNDDDDSGVNSLASSVLSQHDVSGPGLVLDASSKKKKKKRKV